MEYANLFKTKNLPANFEFWASVTRVVADRIDSANADAVYAAEADELALSFGKLLGSESPELSQYGDLVLLFVERMTHYAEDPEAQASVKEVYASAAHLIARQNYRDRFGSAFGKLEFQLDGANETFDDLEEAVDELKDSLDELREELDQLRQTVMGFCRPR